MAGYKYMVYFCGGCKKDFLTPAGGRRKRFCPLCGDDIDVALEHTVNFKTPFLKPYAWKKEEDDVLIYGRKQGKTYKEISEVLERTEKACRERARILRDEGLLEHRKLHSKYRGVSYDKTYRKWMAYCRKDGRQIFLGRYEYEIDAALAYNDRAKEIWGSEAILNEFEGEKMHA